MTTRERQDRIVDILTEAEEPVSASHLAARLGVSLATIERDLAAIRRNGTRVETRPGRAGGAYIRRSARGSSETAGAGQALPPTGGDAFVGRRLEIATLRSAHDRLRASGLTIVLLSGESGVGKTRLASEFALACAAVGTAVVHGRPMPGFSTPPLWAWINVLEALGERQDNEARYEGSDGPSRTHPSESQIRDRQFRLFDGVVHHLAGAVVRPTLIVLDDLHEADPATLRLLRVLRGLGRPGAAHDRRHLRQLPRRAAEPAQQHARRPHTRPGRGTHPRPPAR